MDIEAIRTYCLKKPGHITEETPFGDAVLVFKVQGKMFLLANLSQFPLTINLKSEPSRAIELRERYDAVRPGYHMNKKHWNTVTLDGSLPAPVVRQMIDESYAGVVNVLKRSARPRPE
ncbi:MAG: MmcQ/YjbR family DNA-binding protein [Ignavibacteria bacterium]|nr:MmcQ/YjbR family DNA-binding protein [Ignavibacteria bacterium]